MKNPSAYLKMRVLGAIDLAEGRTMAERLKKVASMTFVDEDGQPRTFTWRTIQTWFYYYKHYGVTRLNTKTRSDRGKARKVTPEELLEAINQVLPLFREKAYNKSAIYRKCIEKGLLKKENIGPTTFYRFIREYDLLDSCPGKNNKKRMAFAMQYANQLWQADTMFGPYVEQGGKKIQTKLIAFIDDASRLICHGEFFFSEVTPNLMSALKKAFYKRGVPKQLYVDNGSIYSSSEITMVCARVGCILRHTPVRDGAAKGKIERFFRRVRDQFLALKLDLSSLDSLNRQFTEWVENDYNNSPHSAISMKPIDRFGMDLKQINYLPPSEVNDELFYIEETRKVKKDNTFSFKGVRFEAPAYLHQKEITIRFDRENPHNTAIVYYRGERMGPARPLDLITNGQLKRSKEDK